MSKNQRQSAILHDTYFNNPPSLIRLFLIRLILLCGLSASAVYAIGDLFLMEYGLTEAAITAGIVSAAVFALASVVPAWAVYLLSLGSIAAIFLNDEIREKLTFFFDYLMLSLDSRLLDTARFVINKEASGIQTEEACILGFCIAGALIGVLFAAVTRTRFRVFYALLIFAAFAAPAFVAEIAGYHPSIAVFSAFFLAFFAIRMGYELDGMIVFEKHNMAGEKSKRNEKSYRRRTGFAIFFRKLRNDIPRYFKFSPNAFIALITSGALMLAIGNAVPQGTTFDYEKLLSSVQEAGADLAAKLEEQFGVEFGTASVQSEYFSYSQYGDNSGGIGISKPSDSATPVLDVTLGRNDIPVYLKGDIGVYFTGTTWTSLKDNYENFKVWEQISDFYPEIYYQMARYTANALAYNPDDFLPLQKVSVTYRRRTAVVFQPLAVYEPDYKTSEYFDSFGDYVLRTKSGDNYLNTIENLALTPNMNFKGVEEIISNRLFPFSEEFNDYIDFNSAYIEYVDKMYCKNSTNIYKRYEENNPVEIDGLINKLYEGGYIDDTMSPYAKAQGICDYFRQNFSYSLSVDNGEGAEVLDNFLYNTKQGHCALFATATTLALRELGVPARYVTGYVVAGEGEYSDTGYSYTLRERDLHAWVEAYIDGIGWLPFDPTAAVEGFDGMAAQGVQKEETPIVTTSVTTTATTTSAYPITTPSDEGKDTAEITEETEITTLPPDTSESGVGEGGASAETPVEKNEYLPFIITALCVIAAVVLIVIAVRLFLKRLEQAEKKVWQGFKKKTPYRACGEMYKLIMLILEKEGLTPGCEMLNDFAVRVDGSIFLKGANVFLVDVMPVFIKCEFGTPETAPVSEEERAAVYKFTSAIYRKYMDSRHPIIRFITKISLFL